MVAICGVTYDIAMVCDSCPEAITLCPKNKRQRYEILP